MYCVHYLMNAAQREIFERLFGAVSGATANIAWYSTTSARRSASAIERWETLSLLRSLKDASQRTRSSTSCLNIAVLRTSNSLLTKINCTKFLDFNLHFTDTLVCWSYNPRSNKSLLHYKSANSKLMKRGIMSSFLSTLQKSCAHTAVASFNSQLECLLSTGYPDHLIRSTSESLLQKIKSTERKQQLLIQQPP